MIKMLSEQEFSDLIRKDADAAVADGVGHRRPVNSCPANPTADHRVAYALGDVLLAAEGAFEQGATLEEVTRAAEAAYYSVRRKKAGPQ